MHKLLAQLNQKYLLLLKKVAKWGLILFGITVLGLGVGGQFVLQQFQKGSQNDNTELSKDTEGNTSVLYKDSALPKDYSEELDASGPELIYENQARAARAKDATTAEGARGEDGPVAPAIRLHGDDVKSIPALADRFLATWEDFQPSTTPDAYKQKLWNYMSSTTQDEPDQLLKRQDSYQAALIGPGRSVGSQMVFDGYTPSGSMVVQRYDGKTAYVTSIGEVVLGGQGLVMRGKRYIRSYALVLVKENGSWKVSRVVAQTLNEVIG